MAWHECQAIFVFSIKQYMSNTKLREFIKDELIMHGVCCFIDYAISDRCDGIVIIRLDDGVLSVDGVRFDGSLDKWLDEYFGQI